MKLVKIIIKLLVLIGIGFVAYRIFSLLGPIDSFAHVFTLVLLLLLVATLFGDAIYGLAASLYSDVFKRN